MSQTVIERGGESVIQQMTQQKYGKQEARERRLQQQRAQRSARAALREAVKDLPDDLADQVMARRMSLEKARAWAQLRDAFGGDTETLQRVLWEAVA